MRTPRKAGGSVSVGGLERYVGDFAIKQGKALKTLDKIGKKVAVIGSGPSGLSCAADLIRNGFDVTVYEAFHKAGGVLIYGIPEFRLPKDIVKNEIEKLENAGVKFKLNTVIGKTFTLNELEKNTTLCSSERARDCLRFEYKRRKSYRRLQRK